MPTLEQAKKAWLHMQKGKQYYDAMTEEQKKAAWQYGYDRGLIQMDKLGPGASAEYQKYVNPSRPEYKPQASIVRQNVPQPIQTQNEKIMSVVTPSIVKNMASQSPEQMAADRRRILNEQRLAEYNPPQPMTPQPINTGRKPVVQHGKVPLRKESAPTFDPVKGLGNLALNTLSTINSVLQTPATMGKYGVESMEQAKAEGKSPIGGLLKGYGVGLGKAITNQDAVENIEVLEGVAPKTTAALKEKFPNTYNAASVIVNMLGVDDLTAIGLIGDIAKVRKLNKGINTTADLVKISEAGIKDAEKVARLMQNPDIAKVVDNIPEKELDNIMYVDPYGNVRKTPAMDLQLPAAKTDISQMPPSKNIDVPFKITPAEQARIAPKLELPIKPVGPQKVSSNINTIPIENKSLTGALKATDEVAATKGAKTVQEVIEKAPTKKDISGFQAYTTDVYRNFENVFGEDYAAVKKDILDPFDNAKKAKTIEDRKLMSNLKTNIVDKFNIQKGSKESALIQQFGEKRLSYESLVDKVGKAKADNIVEADKWFRAEYDRLIDEVNTARAAVYPNQPDKIIPRRTDYYRHFKEFSDDFAGLKNVFETPSQISPSLVGTSEFTKPKSKFLSFAQKRGQGKFTDDAVGGFLDYINAATYAKHIDTQIPNFRALTTSLKESTEQSKNLNHFIEYLTDFTNDLAGKTNPADRFAQKIIPGGRTTFKAINWLNSRVKANTVLGNLSSTLSQIANVPQGIAYVKNPAHLTKGAGNFMGSIFGKGDADLYKKSGFLLERYADNVARQFDVKLLDQPKKVAAWMLGALDEVGTKFIWSSTYQKALADGIKNPIKHADDIARKMVAGRGIGEVPLLQKSKIMQLVAPFTVEVNNLWKVQKDFIKAKDFGGLALLYLANFALNKGLEEVRGDGVVFDPIQAIYEASTEKDLKPIERVGRLGGEVLSNMPLGSTVASLYPEYGISNDFVDLPTREKLFGRTDPTRYGSGLLVAKGIQDPLYKVLPPFAGGQAKKTIQAGQDLGLLPKLKKEEGKLLPTLKKQDLPASYSKTKAGDRLRTTIDKTPSTTAKGLMFGRGAIPEVKKYYESGKVPFGTKQTENIEKLIRKGYEPNKLFEALNGIRGTSKKKDIVVKLREYGYNDREINEIWEIFYK